jgi:hypothetical protein
VFEWFNNPNDGNGPEDVPENGTDFDKSILSIHII